MSGDDDSEDEERFLALMAGCDESLAAGDTPDVVAAASPSHQSRLTRNLDVIRLVRQILRRPVEPTRPGLDTTALPASVPAQLGRFQVQSELGRGGMGVVYRAYDTKRDQVVALKSLPWLEPTALYRFKAEFRRLADVSHPNLVPLYELFAEGRQWFFTMELVHGLDFLAYVRGTASSPPVDLQRIRETLRQLSEGVAALHGSGILHRDIKPSNVLVTFSGRVVVLDFGLAADLGQSAPQPSGQPYALGTIPYISPEQAAGRAVAQASDWYSVGVMLYVALTGRMPFSGSALDILRDKTQREPRAPHELNSRVPEDLDRLCVELLRRDPHQRPSGQEVLGRLARSGAAKEGMVVPREPKETHSALVGREPHFQALAEAFRIVQQGRPATVYVRGESGVGKTALVQSFLDTLRNQNQAVILTAQCFEQESVPYKAFDGLVDALTGYLGRIDPGDVQALLPHDVTPLAQVFPVLRRVNAVNVSAQRMIEIPDLQEVRRRAFGGLRELLARLGERRPLVLFIDDLQWGDLDSAAVLPDLLGPPDPPVLLLLACFRSEEAEASPFLRELLLRRGVTEVATQQTELAVGALESGEARDLASQLLGDAATTALVNAIARESDGNPFLVHALAHHVRAEEAENLGLVEGVSFERVFGKRVAELPEGARRLLEIVAVAGQPLGEQEVCRAAALAGNELTAIRVLQSHRLVRATSGAEQSGITTYHDRVREAVRSGLLPAVVRKHHQSLACSLELSGRADPEVLAAHFHGALELERASGYYILAADHSAKTLAFERAARLYRLALELRPVHGEEERSLRGRLGDSLANAGRGAEAAPEFLAAANSASALQSILWRQRAASQYLVSGHVDEGLRVQGEVLAALGLSLPQTPRQALMLLLLRRTRLWLRGLGFRERVAGEIAAEELTRIDLCDAASFGIAPYDNILAASFQSLGLLLALRAGERTRLAKALFAETIFSSLGGGKTARRTARLLALGEQILPPVDDPRLSATLALARGFAAGMQGQSRRAVECFAVAEQIYRDRCSDVRWGINIAQTLGMRYLYTLGEVAELGRRLPPAIDEARARGDRYALAYMFSILKPYLQLAADQPQDARRDLDTFQDGWTLSRVTIPEIMLGFVRVELDLYLADPAAAIKHFEEFAKMIAGSLHMHAQLFRILRSELRARVSLTVAGTTRNAWPHLRSAQRDVRLLERERMPWGNAMARLVRAGVASLRHDEVNAVRLLREAVDGLEAVEMGLHAAAARRRLGELLGGVEGGALIAQADSWMTAQKIVNPVRMTGMYAPGFP
jgi:hypothetical protein